MKLIVALTLLLSTTAALSQEFAPLRNVVTCRNPNKTTQVSFSFEGGACQRTQSARIYQVDDKLVRVLVPSYQTDQVCTMQMVHFDYTTTVLAPLTAETIDVILLAPDGELQGRGEAQVTETCPSKDEPPGSQRPAYRL